LDSKFFAAKDDPHPQADSDWGLFIIEKALLISSYMVGVRVRIRVGIRDRVILS
jgi:hypothetical protein